jgi:hypothetical protein
MHLSVADIKTTVGFQGIFNKVNDMRTAAACYKYERMKVVPVALFQMIDILGKILKAKEIKVFPFHFSSLDVFNGIINKFFFFRHTKIKVTGMFK